MYPVSEKIITFNNVRLPEILPYKYESMAENAFIFYRGTCHLFNHDLSISQHFPASPLTWACGDLHIENYGSYRGNNRVVYFDINDFDEGLLVPATWEIVRMLTSILVAFDTLSIRKKEALNTVRLFLQSYCDTLRKGKSMSIDPRTAVGIVCTFLRKQETQKLNALLGKHTRSKHGKLSFKLDDCHLFDVEKIGHVGLKDELLGHITDWITACDYAPEHFKAIDVAFRLAGTGSVGVKRYVFLLQNERNKKKYLLLDMKQLCGSSLAQYVNIHQPVWATEADRVVAVQERMQNVSPALLSANTFRDEYFVIKEMQPTEDKLDFGLMKKRYDDMALTVTDMARLAASAQLRSSGRQGSASADELIAFGNNHQWQDDLIAYAATYAKKAKSDFKQFKSDYLKKDIFPKPVKNCR